MKIRRLAALVVTMALVSTTRAESVTTFDTDWRFTRGDPAGAQQTQFDDAGWNAVELPHDWSIAGPMAPTFYE
jgi:beta-galactosidase